MRFFSHMGTSELIINLKNINMQFLNIVAKKDDLVAPSSSKALNDALTESNDKNLVGLMIGLAVVLAIECTLIYLAF